MRKRNTESIGEVLKEFFNENQFLKAKIAESRILSGWATVLGNTVSSYTTNLYFKNGILYVHLSSSVLRSELMLSKDKLISTLNKHAQTDIIKNIIFR